MFIKPRKAATVSIVKNNHGTIEVLLMLRHLEDRFLPDYHVFPGGAFDDQDYDFEFPENQSTNYLKDFDGNLKDYYGYILCGIRETFEESGLLFAVDRNGNYPQINNEKSIKKFALYRRDVFEKKISFRDMLMKENLLPAVDKFFYISRWITPVLFPIRYDARFFAAAAPENQEISHDGDELVDFQWMTPEDALQSYRTGKIKLVMPTIKTLEFLNRFKTTEDLIADLRKKF